MSSDTPVNLKNLPWGSFLFLTVTFWFCSRPNFFYSVEDPPVAAALQGARPDDWTKALALAVFTVWSGYTLLRGRRFSLSVKLAPLAFLLGYIGWCAASILWSDHVGMTVLKLVPLLISCLGAVAMCYRFALEELAALSFLSCSAMAAVGLVAEIALGSFQPWDADYRFKGVWHPNLQAINLGAAILAGIALASRWRRFQLPILVTVFGALSLLFLTRSRTAFASTVLSVACTWLLRQSAPRKFALAGFAAVLATSVLWLASAGLLAFSSDPLLLGRQDSDATTLTNRIPLWQECLRFFKERPILGYGFGAFWTPDTTSDVSVPPEMAWFPLSERKIADNLYVDAAHNTYLEMALGTGLVGASLFVMSMATGIRAYAVRAAARSSALSAYGFSVLVAVALNMMLEALTFQPYMPLLMCPILLIRMGVVTEPADESRIRTWDREDARV